MKIAPISVQMLNIMGTDLTVVNAARVSMAKESQFEFEIIPDEIFGEVHETRLSDADTRLITYLAKHNHWTPFSHPAVSFRIKAPIVVARQWFKHMIGFSRNEVSRRYVDDAPEVFIPETIRMRPSGSVKQGSGGTHPDTKDWRAAMEAICANAVAAYELMIADGVAPEQARGVLPQWMMTEWIETASLAAICRACKLRLDPHAQYETREIAERMAEIVSAQFPVSWSALMDC